MRMIKVRIKFFFDKLIKLEKSKNICFSKKVEIHCKNLVQLSMKQMVLICLNLLIPPKHLYRLIKITKKYFQFL